MAEAAARPSVPATTTDQQGTYAVEQPSGRVSTRAAVLIAIAAASGLAVYVADKVPRASAPRRLGRREMKVKAFFQRSRRLTGAASQAVCQDSMRWDQMPWNYLSFQEREDWYALGWTETSWNLAHVDDGARRLTGVINSAAYQANRPPADQRCYQDLTEDQQDAVRSLSYNIETWHLCKAPTCSWPANEPLMNASCFERMQHLEQRYNHTIPWNNFTVAKRNALLLLGWDPTRWAHVDMPNKYGRPWADMHLQEQQAARFLGYSTDVWEGCISETPCIELLEHLDHKLQALQWSTMPRGTRNTLEVLNWTHHGWLEGMQPAPYMSEWTALPLAQNVAARKLGYVASTWAGCPNAPCADRFAYLQRRYGGRTWMSMKLAYRWAWELLEHSADLWNAGGMDNTRTMEMKWEDLTPEQQSQAEFLGYNDGTWQGCSPVGAGGMDMMGNLSTDPLRPVRVQMTIERPFSEISGNIFGAALQQLPMSFIMVFERAVARALFCENPPLSNDASTYVGTDGLPLCLLLPNYERQQVQQQRIRVVTVREGSIIVDFIIEANVTRNEPTAVFLYEELNRQLSRDNSPLVHDLEFGRFAETASVEEVTFDYLSEQQRVEALAREVMRDQYNEQNACELKSDERNGYIACPVTSSAQSVVYSAPWYRRGLPLLMLAAAGIAHSSSRID